MTFGQENYLNHFLDAYKDRVSQPVLDEVRDHYYTAINAAVAGGRSFDEALADTHEAFGGEHGILSLEWPFQKSLVIRRRDAIEQTLRSYVWGPKVLITIGILLLMWWNNNGPYGMQFAPLAFFAVPGLFSALLHTLSYYSEDMSKRNVFFFFWLGCIVTLAYPVGAYFITKSIQSSGNAYFMGAWSAFQTFFTLVYLANRQHKNSPYLKRKEDIYGAV